MKKLSIICIVLLTLLLSGCNEEVEDLNIEMSTFKLGDTKDEEFGHFVNTHTSKLIKTYEEYLDCLNDAVTSESTRTFKEDFFIDNSLIIVPVLSHKESDFSLKTYKLNDGILEIEILQENNLERKSSDNHYLGNSYMLGFKINSKEIANFSAEIFEQDNYYESYIYTIGTEIVEMVNNYIIIEDYSTYNDLLGNVEPFPIPADSLLDIIDESTFENSFVLVYIEKYLIGAAYIAPIDLYVVQHGAGKKLVLETKKIDSTAPVNGLSHDALLILVIDKGTIDIDDLIINIETE